jgi:capsular exopolysaccharide synthesis family protein
MREIKFKRVEDIDYTRSEAYKSVRANIRFRARDSKVICFTSATASEGKTTTVLNMARTFAAAGQKVLFVDADLRRSVVSERYDAEKITVGLTQYLRSDAKAEDIVCKTNIDNLFMIPTGKCPDNPTELLENDGFGKLMSEVKDDYDFVFIDTPPLGLVIDAALMSVHCDGAVIVIEWNKIRAKVAKRVVEQLEQSGCNIIGGVMTKMPYAGSEYGYGYGSYRSRIYSRYYERYYGRYYGTYEYSRSEYARVENNETSDAGKESKR